MTTTTTPLTTSANAAVIDSNQLQLVTVVTGGYRFALPTTHLSGVYQVARQQMDKDMDMLSTPEGDLPVASLSTLLSLHLGLDLKPSEDERALVAIRSGSQVATIRVGQVSRPIDIPRNHLHRLPNVAHPNDKNKLFSHVAAISPESEDPDEAMALVVDPLKALQFDAGPTDTTAQTSSGSIPAQTNLAGVMPERRGSGQLLAFVPEDVPRQQLNFVFCLPLASVAEVVTAHETMHSPIINDKFGGYIMWRKIPVPIIKLGAAFGMSRLEEDKRQRQRGRRLVIARAGGHRYVGFYTQTQMHSMKAPDSKPTEFEELSKTPHLGAFKTEFGVMVIPNLDQLLDD